MSKRARVAAAAVVVATLLACGLSLDAQGKKPAAGKWLAYEQVWGGARPGVPAQPPVLAPMPVISGWADGERYLEMREDPADKQRKLFAVSVADGSARVYRDYAAIQPLLPKGATAQAPAATSPDESGLVYKADGDLYYYGTASKAVRRLTATPSDEKNPRFSPNGKWIAYTRDNDLFAYDLEQSVEHQYTTDGSDTIYNGWSSWVYMEEILGRASNNAAFWWSPDSSKLAWMRFDDNPVPVFPIYHADGQHGELERQRYPKAGDPNPYVQMWVVPVAAGKAVRMDFDPTADHYIAWPFWTADSKALLVQWMNRGQDIIRFYACDPANGRKTQIFEQKQASWVAFFEDIHYFENGSGFLLRSDVDGWEHLYYYNHDGSLKKRLTSGDWRVNSIAEVDEAGGWVYFVGRPTKSWDAHLMRVRLDGTGLEQITKAEGVHRPLVSPGGKYFIDMTSTVATPAVANLYRTDGTLVRELGTQKTAAMDEYAWGKAEIFTVPSGDGYDLPVSWVLPPDFNPAKKYPVIIAIYGGPDAGSVHNQFLGLAAHYWAERGVIYLGCDHRASGHFGKRGVALMHRSLGKWEMHDYIAVARWLRSKPFVAKDKIAITGGSYGGYTTLMALFYGGGGPECPDGPCFNYGLAGSSVSDWQLYDSVYTERYMDTPRENPDGYRTGSVLTYADRYKGGLYITHGTIDDNVHMQNSMQVIDWLTTNNKPFEMTLYPDSRHGIVQRAHAARTSHDFWVRTLLDGKLPMPPVGAAKTGTGGQR